MTAVALQYPSSHTPDRAPTKTVAEDVAETSPVSVFPPPARRDNSSTSRIGVWIAAGVSAALHAWVIMWVDAPTPPSPAADTGAVSVAIGSLAFASPRSEPVDPAPVPPLPDSAPPEPVSEKQREVVEKSSMQPSKKKTSKAMKAQPAPPTPPVRESEAASSTAASSDAFAHRQDVPMASSSMLSAEVVQPPFTTPPTAPVFITNPDYRSPPRPPVYPQRAIRFGQEGTVLVRAQLSERGDVIDVELREGSGHSLLDKAALKAVRQWLFKPATRDGRAVLATVDLPVHFKLR